MALKEKHRDALRPWLAIIRGYLTRRRDPVSVWAWMIAPFGLGMVFIVALGPHLQMHSVPLLVTDAASIYAAVYPDSLARFPSLSDWLSQSFHWHFLLIAAAVTLVAFSARDVRRFCIMTGVTLALAYTITDLVHVTFDDELRDHIFASLFSNLVGGLIVGALSLVLLWLFAVWRTVLGSGTLANALGAISVLCTAIGISTAGHFLLRTFYFPLPAEVQVSAAFPTEGDFVSGAHHPGVGGNSAEKAVLRNLSFLPEDAEFKRLEVTNWNSFVDFRWSSHPTAQPFQLELSFSRGCYSKRFEERRAWKPTLKFDNVRQVTLEFPNGDLVVRGYSPFNIRRIENTAGYFWLKGVDHSKLLNVTTFTIPDDVYEIGSVGGLDLIVSTFLSRGEDGSAKSQTMRLMVDRKPVRITFSPGTIRPLDSIVSCSEITLDSAEARQLQELGRANLTISEPIGGLMIRLRPSRPAFSLQDHVSTFYAGGLNGWITFDETKFGESEHLGKAHLLSLRDNLSTLTVDGRSIPLEADDRLLMIGNLALEVRQRKTLRAAGKADAVWQNERRLNQTRWERLDDGWKLPLVGALLAGLFATIRFVLIGMKSRLNDDPRSWTV